MVRSAPGAGDRELRAELDRRGREDITAYKVERWRTAGLIERALVERHRGHGSTSVLGAPVEQVADQLEAIAARTWAGRPLATSAVALCADGYDVDEQLLRDGHAKHIEEIGATLNKILATAAAAWTGARPRTALDRADMVASWMVTQRSTHLTRWRRNLSRAKDVIAGSTVERVLHSALSAAMRLVLSGDGSDGGLYEFVTAQGLREFTLAMATGETDPSVTLDRAAEHVGALMRTPATSGRGVAPLTRALDVPIEALRAASILIVQLWDVLLGVPQLGAVLAHAPAPTGHSPVMHSVAVAMLLRNTVTAGIDVEPIAAAALERGLTDAAGAAAMRDAGAVLAELAPEHLGRSA